MQRYHPLIARIFRPDHKPVYESPRRKKHHHAPGYFPTFKAVGSGVRVTSPLSADCLLHLDTNPTVLKISPYPFVVRYSVHDRYGIVGVKKHCPELAILHEDGRVVIMDVIPLAIQREGRLAKRGDAVAEALFNSYGVAYSVMDERDLHIEPRLSNLRTIWRHHRDSDQGCNLAVQRAIDEIGLPTTIGDVRIAAADRAEIVRARNAANHWDAVFTELMVLAFRGAIHLDLSLPFSDQTVITERQKREVF